ARNRGHSPVCAKGPRAARDSPPPARRIGGLLAPFVAWILLALSEKTHMLREVTRGRIHELQKKQRSIRKSGVRRRRARSPRGGGDRRFRARLLQAAAALGQALPPPP